MAKKPSYEELEQRVKALQKKAAKGKQLDKVLRESEEQYRNVVERTHDGVAIIQDGLIKYVNRRLAEMTGYTPDEAINTPFTSYIVYDEISETVESYERLMAGKSVPTRSERTLKHKNGSNIYTEVDGGIITYKNKPADLAIIRDITESKLAEDALRKSEARYRSVVEDQTELICRFLPDGKLTFVNEAYCRYFCKTPGELLGHSFIPLIPEEDQKIVRKQITSLSPETPVVNYEHRVIMPDGTIRWQQWSDRAIFDEQGDLIEFQAVGRDITERKEIEEALQKSAEKIKLFAYSVSHDLKSPAIGIYGLTKLLYQHCGDILDDKAKSYCEQILKSAEQIASLVEMINLYMSSKETPLSVESVKLKEIMQMVRDEFSGQLNIRQIRWQQPDTLPEIKVDRLSFLRIMRNLVDNALKYGGDDLSEIKTGYSESDEFHLISISNDGAAIKQEDSERIFRLFQRNKTSAEVDGTGLGLAIVKELAEKHGGRVWVESRPEKGVTFNISIPRHLGIEQK